MAGRETACDQLVEEDHLVRKDVRGIRVEIVELPEVVVEKARRPRDREERRRPDVGQVVHGPIHLRARFAAPNARISSAGKSYTIGYQIAPENCVK